MSNRSRRASIAAETLAILQAGIYHSPYGQSVSIANDLQTAIHNTTLITPRHARSLQSRAAQALATRNFTTRFEVQNQSTLAAACRLVQTFGPDRVAALNFASAKNPGGGFLGGSQAQEESLTRATGLYPCLQSQPDYYAANRRAATALYTDHLIVSAQVPVFRDDDDQLLDQPWQVTFLTSPAPNAGALAANAPHELDNLVPTFRRRIEQVLAAAITHDQTALVLGAWGCGVFRNDPATVAQLFAEFLLPPGPYATAFEQITFAILDRHGDTFAAFANLFANSIS